MASPKPNICAQPVRTIATVGFCLCIAIAACVAGTMHAAETPVAEPTWVLVRALPVNATVYLDKAACTDAITTPDLVCVPKP